MDWTAPIDIYCERLSRGFWGEPLNAVTNAAFLLAAAAPFLARADRRPEPFVTLLAALVAMIGIGSFLFHTLANRWSMLADILPITLFIYAYLGFALRRYLRLGRLATGAALLLFLPLSAGIEALARPLLGGSAGYLPALLAMLFVALLTHRIGHPAASWLLAAAGIFAVSLTLRTLDAPLCAAMPAGTHFLWHLLNAATLATLLSAAARHVDFKGKVTFPNP
jgi:hypothetical protein